MGAHARNSPSALYRTLNCPPSLVLGEQFQDEESQYAAEGSAGHALAEHLIKKHLHLRTKRPVSDYYSDDLMEAVEDYVAYSPWHSDREGVDRMVTGSSLRDTEK